MSRSRAATHRSTASYADRICGYSTCDLTSRTSTSRCAGSVRIGPALAAGAATGRQISTGPSLSSVTSPW